MKKLLALVLTLSLTLGTLASCASSNSNGSTSGPSSSTSGTSLTDRYVSALETYGGEMVEYNPVLSQVKADDPADAMVLDALGLKVEDMTNFAISISLVNVQAYGLAAIMPAEGKEEAVKASLQGYIDQQASSFETYLVDQYDVAKSARLETLKDGTVLMVMCQDQDTVFDSIRKAIEEA